MMMHNCIAGMAEPLYGFVSQVMLVEDEPCELGITCTENGDKIGSGNDQNNLTPDTNFDFHNNNVDRQTGEEFSSDGPARCRASRCDS